MMTQTCSDIRIEKLCVQFHTKLGIVPALQDIQITFPKGNVSGLIGESGSGKSVLGMSILQLLPQTAQIQGQCLYKGKDLYALPEKEMAHLRGREIALIPQNPNESLNPAFRIEKQLLEAVRRRHKEVTPFAKQQYDTLMKRFGFPHPQEISPKYAFQMSGGMNQRLLCVLGLMNQPQWIIADEPTKGLDAILRKQVYQSLTQILQKDTPSMILITHDIAFAHHLCDQLAVLYQGSILEQGASDQLLKNPRHPYTKGLIQALPSKGMHPILPPDEKRLQHNQGCCFYPRCGEALEKCSQHTPKETILPGGGIVKCFLYESAAVKSTPPNC